MIELVYQMGLFVESDLHQPAMILSKRMEKVFIDGRSEQFHPDNASGSACGAALMLSATQARIESI